MRILLLSSEFPPGPGGIGSHAYNLSKELAHNGCELLVISPQDFVPCEESHAFNTSQEFSIIAVDHDKAPLIKAFNRFQLLHHQIKTFHPEILIASGSRSTWLMSPSARLRRLPWSAIGHGSEFGNANNISVKMTRAAFNRADAVIFVSRFTQERAHLVGVNPKSEHVIHNGADGQWFKPGNEGIKEKVAREIGVSPSDPLLLTVGNLTFRKGQEVVIRALPELIIHFPTIRYLMVGLPTEKKKLENLARELNIYEHILFLGSVDQQRLLDYYQACDVFIMTSQRLPNGDVEGFGISVIEAALCQKPAVVSRECGLAEAVEDGVTGLYVPEKDPQATAATINRLLMDSSLRETMGKQAYERAKTRFTWDYVGMKYLRVLQNLIRTQDRTA